MDNRLKHIFVFLFLTTGYTYVVSTDPLCYLRCYRTFYDYAEYPLSDITSMMTSPYYNTSLCTFLFIHGFNATETGPAISALMPTALCRGGWNVCLLNWIVQSRANSLIGVEASFASKVPIVYSVGIELGKAMKKVAVEMKLDCLLVCGHSLGAHVAGTAGNYLKGEGIRIAWIYALDAAIPLFSKVSLFGLGRAVQSGDATMVVAVNTSPGDKGTNASICDVNIWPNRNRTISTDSGEQKQPGCSPTPVKYSPEDFCSHNLCWKLINATLAGFTILISHANTYWEWASSNGAATPVTQLGVDIDPASEGEYFVRTTGQYPYTLGEDGLRS